MLADEILAPDSLPNALETTAGGAELRADIRRAHRFELTEQFTAAVDLTVGENSHGVVTNLSRFLDFARPPADLCWFECVYLHRPRVHGKTLTPGLRTPKRVGLLVNCIDDKHPVYELTLCWTSQVTKEDEKEPEYSLVNVAPSAFFFDFSGGKSETLKKVTNITPLTREEALREAPELKEKEIEAALRLSAVAGFHSASKYWVRFLYQVLQREKNTVSFNAWLNKLMDISRGDWQGENTFWLVAMAFLAARNIAEKEEHPAPDKLNKQRLRKGKLPLLSYTVCKIDRRILVRRAASDTMTTGELRWHFVRGHFKNRKTGMFWWSPHNAGNRAKGVVEKNYELE